MHDIVVVGGGHVGLFTAGQFSKLGYKVLLLDQKDEIGKQIVCTGIISPEAFERFSLPQEAILSQIQTVRFVSPFGSVLRYAHSAVLAQVVDRTRFNKRLAEIAIRQGTEVKVGCQVTEVTPEKDCIRLTLLHKKEASLETVSGRLLIMATGVSYKLNRLAGLETPKDFLNGAQVHLHVNDSGDTVVYLGRKVAPGAFAWVVPLQNGLARIGLLSESDPSSFLARLLDEIAPHWRPELGGASFDLRPVAQKPLRKSAAYRVLAVGEAAGQIKATTGGGIYYGLLGAEAAIETAQGAFQKNRFDERTLGLYDRRWKQKIGDEIEIGYHCRKLFAKFSDEQIEELFKIARSNGIPSLARREVEFDWHKRLLLLLLKMPRIRKLIGLENFKLVPLNLSEPSSV